MTVWRVIVSNFKTIIMKANELRIGNWVHNPIQKIDFQVDGSTIAIEHSREKTFKEHQGFEPIPITEKWLLKCNQFENGETRCDYKIKLTHEEHWLQMNYIGNKWYLYIIDGKSDVYFTELEYVHTLQNILYFNWNIELEFNYEK